MVVEQERVGYADGPDERNKMEAQVRASQQRSDVGHLHSNVGGRGDRLDTDCDSTPASEGKCHNKPHEDDETTDSARKEQKRWHSWQEAERTVHHGTRAPDDRQGVGVGNQRRQQDGGRLNQSRKAKKTPISTIAAHKQMRD